MRILTAIPAYNEADHLPAVLHEVLRHAEHVLVVDDGSRDSTPEILAGFPTVRVIRHETNLGYGAALRTMFRTTVAEGFDGLVTLDCDGQHEPKLIPELIAGLNDADVVSGSRYLRVFDPTQKPPEQRRKINVEITRRLNECLGLNLTDAFCGFKAYRASALAKFDITDLGYAMPLQVWVQAVEHGLVIKEVAVPLIYLDEKRAFGGALDDADYRLRHYLDVFAEALRRARLPVAEGCC
ncbi:MAG: glycosyltransferase family 2 protein [Isosphaeraceae bacterium]|nr:glycosyltransferase family 2 protein [Isosphaeraceae bacterium]